MNDMDSVFEEAKKKVEAAVNGASDFTSVCKVLGLNGANDFRYSDLRGVDFSFSDLRGFDFEGADLTGCKGASVLFDQSTNFTGADIVGSCFEIAVLDSERLLREPHLSRAFQMLDNADALTASSWIHDFFRNRSKIPTNLRELSSEDAGVVFRRLLLSDLDLTKRVDLFYHLDSICKNRNELKSLVLSILAQYSEQEAVILKFISIAADRFSSDSTVGFVLRKLCEDSREAVRIKALIAISKTDYLAGNVNDVLGVVLAKSNTRIRKILILQRAWQLGRSHVSAVNRLGLIDDVTYQDVLDVNEAFDPRIVHDLGEKSVIRRKMNSNFNRLVVAKLDLGDQASVLHEVDRILRLQEEVFFSTVLCGPIVRSLNLSRWKAFSERLRKKQKR